MILKAILGFFSLIKGMRVTLKYLIHPSTVVTQQYPENRETLKLADRTRGQVSFIHDENGYHKCTSCKICEAACPNASIHVIRRDEPVVERNELEFFIWRFDTCTFCNMCVMVCPFGVLEMKTTFESSVYDPRLLVYNLAKYSGPTSKGIEKITDEETKKKAVVPRSVYDGPIALKGVHLAGIPKDLYDDPGAET